MSDSVVVGPRLTRSPPRASSGTTPMAARTCEGWTLPDEQAAPDDTATPARSKAITAVSALMPGTANRVVLGRRSAADPKITIPGEAASRLDFQPVPKRAHSRTGCRQFGSSRTGSSPEARDTGHVLGTGAAAALLSAAPDEGIGQGLGHVPPEQRSDALRTPDFVRGNRQKVSGKVADIAGNSPETLNRIDVQEPARLVHQAGNLGDRLNNPGFVIGQHERNQQPLSRKLDQPTLECAEIDCAAIRDRQLVHHVSGKPAAGENRRVLDGGDQQPLTWRLPGSQRRCQRQHVGLGPPRGEHYIAWFRRDQGGDLLACLLHDLARRPALGMNRGGIADKVERRKHGGARFWSQRGGGVPIEINAIGHGYSRSCRMVLSAGPWAVPNTSETLAFCPGQYAKNPRPVPVPARRRAKLKSTMLLGSYVHLPPPSISGALFAARCGMGHHPNRGLTSMPEVIFTGAGGRLEGRYHPARQRNAPIGIVLHPHPQFGGTMNHQIIYQLYYAFVHRNFSVLRFNFRGVGRSQGAFDHGQGELSDAASALDWAQSINPEARSCWIAGFSFGAWIGMQLLMRRPEIEGFISVAPPANLYDFSFLAPCPSSGLIVHGDKDAVVPHKDVSGLVDKLNTQKGIVIDQKVIPGANHFFDGKIDQLMQAVGAYLDKRLKIERKPSAA